VPRIEAALGRTIGEDGRARLLRAMPGLKPRSKTIVELAESATFLVAERPLKLTDKAREQLDGTGLDVLRGLQAVLEAAPAWTAPALEEATRAFADGRGLKLGKAAQPLRAALTGSTVSPPVFDVAEILGREEALARIADHTQPR
jgi:glutamyl-tRNA synthetase